jgi:hypothetical protein
MKLVFFTGYCKACSENKGQLQSAEYPAAKRILRLVAGYCYRKKEDLKDFTLTSRCISRHFWTALADR